MTIATRTSSIEVAIGKGDVRTIQRGKTWAQFEYLQKGFEDTRGVKLFYYNETIEILMPGAAHELFKKIIAILIEVFLLDRKIEFEPTGSMTQFCEKVWRRLKQMNPMKFREQSCVLKSILLVAMSRNWIAIKN